MLRTLLTAVFAPVLLGAVLWSSNANAQYPYPGPLYEPTADMRLLVTPRQAEVYVDGYYAGVVDDFDGFFQRLHVPPGNHDVTLYLDGYRTVHQQIHVGPSATYKLHYNMEKLGPGETSERPPAAAVPPPPDQEPGPPPRMARPPHGPDYRRPMPPPQEPSEPAAPAPAAPTGGGAYGTLAIRVQPADAEIMIDGQPWNGSGGDSRMLVEVAQGRHHVEIRKEGFGTFSMDVQVHPGETTPINVSLSRERE